MIVTRTPAGRRRWYPAHLSGLRSVRPMSALGDIVPGVFPPVLAKHSKHVSLVDIHSVGVATTKQSYAP